MTTRTLDRTSAMAWECRSPQSFPAAPYPGAHPSGSWTLTGDGHVHALDAVELRVWQDRRTGESVSLEGRNLVLGYGSNLNPRKLAALFVGEQVHVLEADVRDWAAAWCEGRRGNGDVVATLVPDPVGCERHAVLAVTRGQLERMDAWEGHPGYYRRESCTGHLTLADGTVPEAEVYLGTAERRPALLVRGRVLLLRDHAYSVADRLVDGQCW